MGQIQLKEYVRDDIATALGLETDNSSKKRESITDDEEP